MNWKEQGLTYSEYVGIHIWLRYHYGKADKCEFCDNEADRYEYALKKGKVYEKNRDNYLTLCRSCHAKYDDRNPFLYYKKDSQKKVNEAKYIPINQYDIDGKFLQVWKGAKVANDKLKISRSAINNNLKGLSKTAGGFIWRYSGI